MKTRPLWIVKRNPVLPTELYKYASFVRQGRVVTHQYFEAHTFRIKAAAEAVCLMLNNNGSNKWTVVKL